jgi:hypothetical protein
LTVTGGSAVAKKPYIEVFGYRELAKDLVDAGDYAVDRLKAANKAAADIVAGAARPAIPVRSGRLIGTLRTSGTKTGGFVRMGTRAIPYAGPIHFGWPSRPNRAKGWRGGPIKPNPFLYDAMDRRIDEVLSAYTEFIIRGGPLEKLRYRTSGQTFRRGRHS